MAQKLSNFRAGFQGTKEIFHIAKEKWENFLDIFYENHQIWPKIKKHIRNFETSNRSNWSLFEKLWGLKVEIVSYKKKNVVWEFEGLRVCFELVCLTDFLCLFVTGWFWVILFEIFRVCLRVFIFLIVCWCLWQSMCLWMWLWRWGWVWVWVSVFHDNMEWDWVFLSMYTYMVR